MTKILSPSCLLFLLWILPGFADPVRRVQNNVLISDTLPAIRIQIDPAFRFEGSFPFRIQDIAEGYRYVFIDGNPKEVKRMFIAQFESFLPESTEIYRYNFDNALLMEGFRFRHSTFAFSMKEAMKENPDSEAAKTQTFLDKKGYTISDEWMASRFLTLGDDSRKSEMILFYMEPVASTGHKLGEFYKGEERTELWERISKDLETRSRSAFRIQSHN